MSAPTPAPTRFEELSREAGLLDVGRIEPDPGSRDLDSVVNEMPAWPLRLVRRTALDALIRVGRVEALAWWLVLFAGYVAFGWWLAVHGNLIVGDAMSRVASAFFAGSSRDPHLAAVGFVFPPLPTLLEIPFVGLRGLVPQMTSHALAGTMVSAAFMAGAGLEVVRIVRAQTGRPFIARAAGLAFALNPLIVFYGANGMSEAAFVYLTLRGCRSLMEWIRSDDVGGLVVAGAAFALAYLVRYEAVIVAAAAVLVVIAVNAQRRRHAPWRILLNQIVIDAMTLMLPVLLAFAGWAMTSWLVTGEPFAQFTSAYGNSTIIEQVGTGAHRAHGLAAPLTPLETMLLLCPVLPFAALWAAKVLRRRSDVPLAGLVLPIVAVLAFEVYSTASGGTFLFLRYFVLAIPLGLIAGTTLFRRVGTVLCVLSLTVPFATTWIVMSDPSRGVQEHYLRAALFPSTASDDERTMLRQFHTERRLAAALDALHLPDSAVLMDALYGFPVILASDHPKQFVETTDRDFAQVLDRPQESGIRYLVTVPDKGRGRSDALNRRYPGIYEDGARIGRLVFQADSDGPDPPFRVYRLDPAAAQAATGLTP